MSATPLQTIVSTTFYSDREDCLHIRPLGENEEIYSEDITGTTKATDYIMEKLGINQMQCVTTHRDEFFAALEKEKSRAHVGYSIADSLVAPGEYCAYISSFTKDGDNPGVPKVVYVLALKQTEHGLELTDSPVSIPNKVEPVTNMPQVPGYPGAYLNINSDTPESFAVGFDAILEECLTSLTDVIALTTADPVVLPEGYKTFDITFGAAFPTASFGVKDGVGIVEPGIYLPDTVKGCPQLEFDTHMFGDKTISVASVIIPDLNIPGTGITLIGLVALTPEGGLTALHTPEIETQMRGRIQGEVVQVGNWFTNIKYQAAATAIIESVDKHLDDMAYMVLTRYDIESRKAQVAAEGDDDNDPSMGMLAALRSVLGGKMGAMMAQGKMPSFEEFRRMIEEGELPTGVGVDTEDSREGMFDKLKSKLGMTPKKKPTLH